MGPKCEQRLAYASGGYGLEILEICTMPINIVLFYCTLLQTSLSNPVTRRTASSLTVFLIGHNFETIISGEMLSTPTQCHTSVIYDNTGQKTCHNSILFANNKHQYRK